MANNGRVNAADVTTNFDTELTDPEIDAWVDTATELVDDISAADSSIDSTRLEQIELALTRHFASAQDPRVERDSVGDSSLRYQVNVGEGLESTVYGQQAVVLDPTGTLANINKPKASVTVHDTKGIDD